MSQQIPHKPPYLTDGEYSYVLSRDHHQCALRDFCSKAGALEQSDFCSGELDFDHVQCRELGGDDGFANIRLLCSGPNRGRPIIPERKWAETNFWDGKFRSDLLRNIQLLSGYDAILEDPGIKGFAAAFRNKLLRTTTLIAGATGTGKTLTMQAILFAINKSVNDLSSSGSEGVPSRPRCKHVLWLTTDQTLRGLTRTELEDEALILGMVSSKPLVQLAKGYSDFERGPMGADIVVACPHSLWKSDSDKKGIPRRSDDEIRKAVEPYDTIIFDECDWASEQVQFIARNATHALKFSLTASPPVMDGVDESVAHEFMSRFVLISGDAIGDYDRAIRLDQCLKAFPDGADKFEAVASHDSYESLCQGIRTLVTAGKADSDHVVFQSSILEAIVRADQLEQEMILAHPEHYYSPHIIARLERISDIETLMKTLPEAISRLYTSGKIFSPGWEATAVYQGHKRSFPTDEHDLSAKTRDGEYRHPFMRAKNTRGRVYPNQGCKRLLLMANIGVRGLNNWPILFVVDCTGRTSPTEQIQLRGRSIRWPADLAHWWGDKSSRKFLTMITLVPDPTLTKEKAIGIRRSDNFIENMLPIISSAGFLTWSDLAGGKEVESANPKFEETPHPLTQADKFQIMAGIGGEILDRKTIVNDDVEPLADQIVARVKPEMFGTRRDRAKDFAVKLMTDQEFRKSQTISPAAIYEVEVNPVDCTTHLRPKAKYEVDELVRFVQCNPTFQDLREGYIDELESGRATTVGLISNILREEQRVIYRETPRLYKLHSDEPDNKGVVTVIRDSLISDLLRASEISRDKRGEVARAVNSATCKVFGVKDASNDGVLDQHPYHVHIMGRQRQRIIDIAIALLVRWGVLPRLSALSEYDGY